MRAFVAVTPPEDVRAALHDAAEPLRAALDDAVRWVDAAKLHVTVRFLGEQPDALVARLVERVAAAVRGRTPFSASVATPGAFPSLRRPRVLWMGMRANPALDALYEDVARACEAEGLAREPQRWHPHLTLGRVRQGVRVDAAALAGAAGAVRTEETFIVRSVDVMQSELSSAGARYHRLGACLLEGV